LASEVPIELRAAAVCEADVTRKNLSLLQHGRQWPPNGRAIFLSNPAGLINVQPDRRTGNRPQRADDALAADRVRTHIRVTEPV
jgi:hypothetical protein